MEDAFIRVSDRRLRDEHLNLCEFASLAEGHEKREQCRVNIRQQEQRELHGSVEVSADKTRHVALGPVIGAIALAGRVILSVASVKRA